MGDFGSLHAGMAEGTPGHPDQRGLPVDIKFDDCLNG
jgi:hypothetical protein